MECSKKVPYLEETQVKFTQVAFLVSFKHTIELTLEQMFRNNEKMLWQMTETSEEDKP